MDKMWEMLAQMLARRTQPQTSSEAVGTSQQNNTFVGRVPINYFGDFQRTQWTQPQKNSEAGTSQQSLTNSFCGQIYVGAGNVSVGDMVRNPRHECTRLKKYYKDTLCQTSPLPWYPEYAWDIHEVYTELALKGSVNKFGVEELFKQRDERFPKDNCYRIVIESDNGYGKSTLMIKIASDWSKRDSNDHMSYTSRFRLLFIVKLGYVGEDENLLSYMESVYDEKIEEPLENVLNSKIAENVLILLDGYDEANASTKKEVGRIMDKEIMEKFHVVLTSRFGHVPNAVKSKALVVTVESFGLRQVMEAIGKFFIKARHLTKEDVISCIDELSTLNNRSGWRHESIVLNSDDFQNVQEIFPLLPEEKRLGLDQFKQFMFKVRYKSPYKELAQCPLFCVMLCCLVSECPKYELPSTCSGLYFAIINRNLFRAAVKKDRAAGEDEEQWNWDELDSQIREGHESYLQEFGRLCIDGLKTGSMSFSLFDITGNKEAAKTTDVKVTQLIEAGVLVQDFTELNTKEKIPRYQVPHRTTAEFLAAYYLSGETDQNLLQQNLLDLFRLKASFDEVAVSLIEMGKSRCLADAFRVIKFPSDCLDSSFVESYFTQHGAAGTWSEFKDALPNKLQIKTKDHDIIVSSPEPCLTLQLIEEFGKMNTGNTNALRSLLPKDCPVSLHVKEASSLPILLHTSVKSGFVLNSLQLEVFEGEISDQMRKDVARSLQELLKAGSCPVQLSFTYASPGLKKAVIEAMQEVPEACHLRSFEFFPNRKEGDITELSEVLAEKWLSHIQHLGMGSEDWCSGSTLNPILKGLREPGCSLTSLHLRNYGTRKNKGILLLEDLLMLAAKLVTLRLEGMKLHFDVTRTSKYAVKETCSMKNLHLVKVSLSLDGLLPSADENKELFLLGWRNVALSLEELTIDGCTFPIELFSGLNLFVPNLRNLAIGAIHRMTPNNGKELYANQLLEALARSSGDSLEDLSLLQHFWESNKVLMLHPIREALQRCPRMKAVNLGISWLTDTSQVSIGPAPDPSIPLSSNDRKALDNKNINLALLEIVLSVSKLRTLTMKSYLPRTFHAIADKAEKWPGKTNDKECKTSLTLHDLSNENACLAMQVFKKRGLEYRLTYVTDEVYELWFPAKCITEPGASNNAVSLLEQGNGKKSIAYIDSRYEDKGNSSQKASSYMDIRKNIPTKNVKANTVWEGGIVGNQRDKCMELKEYYLNTFCCESPLPWCPQYACDIDEVYTELALQNSATSKFGVEELFKRAHESFRKGGSYRILIEGDNGYGKSTLMRKIASDWSKRDSIDPMNYTSPFSLLFVVQLGYVGEEGNLLSYMASVYEGKMDTPVKDLLESEKAEKVLILLDGYDEANANTKKEVDRIMKKEKMMECHVVLTSRFGHAPDAVKSKALRVTVKGFGRKQVTVAVGKFFIKARHLTVTNVEQCCKDELLTPKGARLGKSDDLPSIDFKNIQEISPLLPEEKRLGLDQFKEFMKKVQDYSPYKELAQCPLLCVMLCCLISECPNGELLSTCSGLYFAMINRNLYRAARKKAEAAGKKDVKWNLSVLDSRIRQGHESYLQEFGRLCIDGLKTRSMSFTLFDITGNEDDAETSDVRITQLIEAGVLVQDFTELNTKEEIPRYQVPHRTTAEFLAAYYLSGETDQNLLQQNLLDLFRLKASFDEVGVFLIEMGKPRCLADAFRVIKFPSDCLKYIPFMENYFTQHGAAGTWSEFKDALPNQLKILTMGHDIIVSSSEPSITLLELVEEFSKMNTGNTNALRSLLKKDCLVSLHVKEAPSLPILLQTLVKSGFVLNRLQLEVFEGEICDQMRQDVVRSLQELLKAGSCPVQLSFTDASLGLRNAVIEAMQEVPEACRLRSFELFPDWDRNVYRDTTQLLKVLVEKWLSHLQHLGMGSECWGSGNTLTPILKRLTEPGCSLTSLHLCGYYGDNNGGMVPEDLMTLASKLDTLKLGEMNLHFDVTRISNAVKEKCSLKSLHLKDIKLKLKGLLPSADENKELLLGWRNVALHLEELTIDRCEFPVELLSWLNLSVPNLRTISIGRVEKWTPNNGTDSYANQLLEALTRSSGESIEELSLECSFWESSKVLMLHPIREALQRCPRMKKVKLEILGDSLPKSIGPDPSTPLSSSDVEAFNSDNMYLALLKIVLSVPMLQILTSEFFFEYWGKIGTFHAIADKAKKWPGKSFDSECDTLTLQGLSNENACHAMHVFRERGLEYRLRYVSDKVYKLWFPV